MKITSVSEKLTAIQILLKDCIEQQSEIERKIEVINFTAYNANPENPMEAEGALRLILNHCNGIMGDK